MLFFQEIDGYSIQGAVRQHHQQSVVLTNFFHVSQKMMLLGRLLHMMLPDYSVEDVVMAPMEK